MNIKLWYKYLMSYSSCTMKQDMFGKCSGVCDGKCEEHYPYGTKSLRGLIQNVEDIVDLIDSCVYEDKKFANSITNVNAWVGYSRAKKISQMKFIFSAYLEQEEDNNE